MLSIYIYIMCENNYLSSQCSTWKITALPVHFSLIKKNFTVFSLTLEATQRMNYILIKSLKLQMEKNAYPLRMNLVKNSLINCNYVHCSRSLLI